MKLYEREVRCARRDKTLLVGRYMVPLVIGTLVGLVFLGAADTDNGETKDFNAHYGGMIIFCQASMMTSVRAALLTDLLGFVLMSALCYQGTPVMVTFPAERPVFLREYTNGSCKPLFPHFSLLRSVELMIVLADGAKAYMLSKLMLEAPMTLLQCLEMTILFYFFLGMQGEQ